MKRHRILQEAERRVGRLLQPTPRKFSDPQSRAAKYGRKERGEEQQEDDMPGLGVEEGEEGEV